MRRPVRHVLLGAFAAAALSALGAGVWVVATPSPARTAEETLPTPPEPPRLADGPEAQRCLALLGLDAEAAHAFAEAWKEQGGGEGAQHCRALSILALGQPMRAAEMLEALAARSQAGHAARAAVFAQAAQAFLMAGESNRAFGATTLALTLTPEDADLLIDRAVALGTLGRYREAIEDLDRALGRDPDRAEALVFRAASWRHLDRRQEAARDIERALALAPDNPEAFLERGILRQLGGDAEGAREDWERAIALAPDTPTADLAVQNLALNEAGPQRR